MSVFNIQHNMLQVVYTLFYIFNSETWLCLLNSDYSEGNFMYIIHQSYQLQNRNLNDSQNNWITVLISVCFIFLGFIFKKIPFQRLPCAVSIMFTLSGIVVELSRLWILTTHFEQLKIETFLQHGCSSSLQEVTWHFARHSGILCSFEGYCFSICTLCQCSIVSAWFQY